MAQKNRIDLKDDVDVKLPDGGSITAQDHRSLEKDEIDSFLNIVEDDSGVIRFDSISGSNVKQEILNNRNSLATRPERLETGYITLGNAFGLTVGNSLSVDGDFYDCVVAFSDSTDTLLTVYLTTPLPGSNYTIRFEMESRSGDFNNDNDVIHPITKNKTASSFQVGYRAMNTSVTRNIRLHVELYFNNY